MKKAAKNRAAFVKNSDADKQAKPAAKEPARPSQGKSGLPIFNWITEVLR